MKGKKTGGRTKGTPNKITRELRELISEFLQTNFAKIEKDFQKLAPKDRAKLYCDLLPFGVSKLTRHELENKGDSIPILMSVIHPLTGYSVEEQKILLDNE